MIAKKDEAALQALAASEETLDIKQQQETYLQYQSGRKAWDQFSNEHVYQKKHDGSSSQHHVDHEYEEIPTPPTVRHLKHPNQMKEEVPEGNTEKLGASYDFSDLTVGSLIQMPSFLPASPWRYGTIKWIGVDPSVQGKIAGIELDEAMDGCTDGTFHRTGQKFFSCPSGKGVYYPLQKLRPDARYAPEVAADGNCQIDTATVEELKRIIKLQEEKMRDAESTHQRQIERFQSEIHTAQQEKVAETRKSAQFQRQVNDLVKANEQLKKTNEQLNSLVKEKDKEIFELQQKLEAESNSDLIEMQQGSVSWNISRAEVRNLPKKEIGSGAWGLVYSANFRGENVAIKYAHRDLLHEKTVGMLKREIMIMAHIQHPNLVRFVAAVLDSAVERGTDTPIIISELMDMNLRFAYTRFNLSNQLISLFSDVAYALHYLHQRQPSIIHRDVSAPNVLLKALPHGGYKAKVSDFGSANLVKHAQTAGAGAIVYCAPEMFPSEDVTKPPQPQTTKVDIFSYGVLLLEVVVREMPTPQSRYTLLQRVKTQWNAIYELIVLCMKPSPDDRPTMAGILKWLNRCQH